jgi:hypothetical protein
MKQSIDEVGAARSMANTAQRQLRAARPAPSAKGRKASSTPSFRALAVRVVIAAFLVLAVMYGLNVLMPMAFNLIGGRS